MSFGLRGAEKTTHLDELLGINVVAGGECIFKYDLMWGPESSKKGAEPPQLQTLTCWRNQGRGGAA